MEVIILKFKAIVPKR